MVDGSILKPHDTIPVIGLMTYFYIALRDQSTAGKFQETLLIICDAW